MSSASTFDIGDILSQYALITSEQLQSAETNRGSARLDRFLIESGAVTEEQVLEIYSQEFGLPKRSLAGLELNEQLLEGFPSADLFRHELLPLEEVGNTVHVAISDPFHLDALDELASKTGFRLTPVLVRHDEIVSAIKSLYGLGGGTVENMVLQHDGGDQEELESADPDDLAQHASVVRLVNEMFADAVRQEASDIHFEPEIDGVSLRFRVDGMLRVEPIPPQIKQFAAAIVSRIKIMAKLNIAEKRLPQDGRISIRVAGRELDVRVSTIPMVHGESIVMRLLDKGNRRFDMNSLDLDSELQSRLLTLATRPHGIVLVTGPTGSGKTTTLYSTLASIREATKKIITVEDPVEYHLRGVYQIQVQPKIGLDFACGLRSILRHDPDVLLVGEIRDRETAEIAVQCALTGHLVFSTLHTNDAPSAFTRLIDMGLEPYLVSSTVTAVLAQRLVRKLCPHCKRGVSPSETELPPGFSEQCEQIFEPNGCSECRSTGYRGRTGIYELLQPSEAIRELVQKNASAIELASVARQEGMLTLRESGWQRVRAGLTSVDEVLRVTAAE